MLYTSTTPLIRKEISVYIKLLNYEKYVSYQYDIFSEEFILKDARSYIFFRENNHRVPDVDDCTGFPENLKEYEHHGTDH